MSSAITKPPFGHVLDDGVELHPMMPHDAYVDGFHNFLVENRDYIGQWLGWAYMFDTREAVKTRVERICRRIAEGKSINLCIFVEGVYAGGLVLNINSRKHNVGEIGYWLGEKYTGRGIITKAVRFAVNYGFETFKLNRIIIRCATENIPSQRVPQRLNFTREAVQRAAYRRDDTYFDMIIYSMLAHEWEG